MIADAVDETPAARREPLRRLHPPLSDQDAQIGLTKPKISGTIDPQVPCACPGCGHAGNAHRIGATVIVEYGLAAYIYTSRLQEALRIGESIDAGMVGINRGIVSDPSAPFGGTNQSGLGREGGRDGMREYFSVDFE
jgi:hypothetical protein